MKTTPNIISGDELRRYAPLFKKALRLIRYASMTYRRSFVRRFPDAMDRRAISFFNARMQNMLAKGGLPEKYKCMSGKRKRLYRRAAKYFEQIVKEVE